MCILQCLGYCPKSYVRVLTQSNTLTIAREKAAKALKEKGETPEELLQSIKENEAAAAEAQRTVDAWKAIVGEKARREEAAKAEAERIATEKAEEEARVEAERKAEEEHIAAEKSEERKERDENGQPFVVSSDGTTTFGEITEDTGLTAAPIKLSEGFQDANTGKGYGLVHIEANHGEQIRQAGFTSVKEFVSFVATNYDPDNIRVGKRRDDGSDTFLIQVTDTHDNTLFIELSKDGSYWNVNSGGIFRKGYSNKKETVAKTEPQQPTNAVSSDSSLSANVKDGITNAEPNGEPTVSLDKGTTLPADQQTSDKENTKKVADSEGENTLKAKIEAASADVNTEPTEAQKEAGNYKKGHVQVGTFDITIEQPEGSIRRGTDADGKKWESKMHNTYGYFRGTEGVDGDHIDVFLSNDIDGWNGRKVFVVDQYNPDGTFDEHKVMLGFNDMDEAKSDYLANYEKGWENGRRIDISSTNLEDFEKWIGSSHRKTKPFSEYSSVNKETVATDKGSEVGGEKQEAEKKRPAPIAERIEDVGEKIGDARKDVWKEIIARVKNKKQGIEEALKKSSAGKLFSSLFDEKELLESGVSNEVVTFISAVKGSLGTKPKSLSKLKMWINKVLHQYDMCEQALENWESVKKKIDEWKYYSQPFYMYRAAMAVGGYESGRDVGNAELWQIADGYSDGKSVAGQWCVRKAGAYDGIYKTYEEAAEALKKFAGENAAVDGKGKRKEVKLAIYKRRTDGTMFIAPEGKPDVIIQDGFKTLYEASAYKKEHYAEMQERYRTLMDGIKPKFNENRERKGRDWRGGKDVSAEDFREAFDFRGVEFGNWMQQKDRRQALNECYDSLMDLAMVCGVSPKALSLGGKLAMAFGARGGGKFNAHYEPDKVVINLTKTKGAGSLAHEWFHAIDNYFNMQGWDEFATESTRNVERKEMAEAWKDLVRAINGSDYFKRSDKYARLKGSRYWIEPTELGARAFAVWVENKLSKYGTINDYLANNPRLVDEKASDAEKKYAPYPFDKDADWMDEKFGRLFEVMQERVDEETGKHILYSRNKAAGHENTELTAEERELRDNLVERMRKGGLDVVTDSEEMQRVIDTENERTRNMFVGEKGATEADKAEEVSTRLDNLSVARRMEEAKKDAKTIKMATGWERGSDGKWRYETSDIKPKPFEDWMDKKNLKLGDIIDSDGGLFEMYPELKDFKVTRGKGKSTNAAIYTGLGKIEINFSKFKPYMSIPSNREKINGILHRVINHEIQHAIQDSEGFAQGVSPNAFRPDAPIGKLREMEEADGRMVERYNAMSYTEKALGEGVRLKERILENRKEYNALASKYRFGMDGYTRAAGEVEARNTEKRIGMTEEERRASLASETEDVAREDQILLGVDNADGEQRFLRTAGGEVYGLVKDGRIYLDPKVATAETAVHEYTHLWGDMLRRKDSEQWSHTVKELKNSVLWE
ncbi:MAG: LPD5 domain-containing protein, partial [Muribaculaceae bacterium]|nr:LPD5 domain-containing protein [Muribaculaceae bacterium]